MYYKWIEHHFLCDECSNGIRYISTPYIAAKKDLKKNKWVLSKNKTICPVCNNKEISYEYKRMLEGVESISV